MLKASASAPPLMAKLKVVAPSASLALMVVSATAFSDIVNAAAAPPPSLVMSGASATACTARLAALAVALLASVTW